MASEISSACRNLPVQLPNTCSMRSFLLILLSVSLYSACKKTAVSTTNIQGDWELRYIQNIATGAREYKPASLTSIPQISFNDPINGVFNGRTPVNIIQGSYEVFEGNRIRFPQVVMVTKVFETIWGGRYISALENAVSFSGSGPDVLIINSPVDQLVFRRK
jgi:hypothetical protein